MGFPLRSRTQQTAGLLARVLASSHFYSASFLLYIMSFRLNLVLTSNLLSCVVKLTSLSSDVNCSSSWENPNNKTLVSKPADPCCTVPGCAGDLPFGSR